MTYVAVCIFALRLVRLLMNIYGALALSHLIYRTMLGGTDYGLTLERKSVRLQLSEFAPSHFLLELHLRVHTIHISGRRHPRHLCPRLPLAAGAHSAHGQGRPEALQWPSPRDWPELIHERLSSLVLWWDDSSAWVLSAPTPERPQLSHLQQLMVTSHR